MPAVAAVVMLALAPATAEAEWQSAITLSTPTDLASYPQVAFDRQGNATAVWMELQPGSSTRYVVMSSTRPSATGTWTHPVALSPPEQYSGNPEIAVTPSGAAVVVWEAGLESASVTSGPPYVQGAFRFSASSAWRRPARISPSGVAAYMPRVGIDASGHAVALWFAQGRDRSRIGSASGSVSSGRWAKPVQLAVDRRELINPQIAVSARGGAAAVWEIVVSGSPLRGQTNTVMVARKPAGRRWLHPVKLGTETDLPYQASASFEFPGPQVATNPAGDAIVVWQGKVSDSFTAEASVARARRSWQKPTRITSRFALTPHVAMDAHGDATVVWEGSGGSVVAARKALTAHRWSRAKTLAPGKSDINPYPQVAVDPFGDAIATWSGNPVQAAVRRGLDGGWQRAVKLGPGGVSQGALDSRGSAIVVWQQNEIVMAAAGA